MGAWGGFEGDGMTGNGLLVITEVKGIRVNQFTKVDQAVPAGEYNGDKQEVIVGGVSW